jgi:hypothetical protein
MHFLVSILRPQAISDAHSGRDHPPPTPRISNPPLLWSRRVPYPCEYCHGPDMYVTFMVVRFPVYFAALMARRPLSLLLSPAPPHRRSSRSSISVLLRNIILYPYHIHIHILLYSYSD